MASTAGEILTVAQQLAAFSGLDGQVRGTWAAGVGCVEVAKCISSIERGPALEGQPGEVDFRKVFDYKSKASLEIEIDAAEFGLDYGVEKRDVAVKTVSVKVKVQRGLDLTKESWYSGSDPYVEVTGSTTAKTAVKKAVGDNPVQWDEEVVIKVEVDDDGVNLIPRHPLRVRLLDKCGFWRPDVLLAIGEANVKQLKAKQKHSLVLKLVNDSVAEFVEAHSNEARIHIKNICFLKNRLQAAGFSGNLHWTFGALGSAGVVERGLGVSFDIPFTGGVSATTAEGSKDFVSWTEKKVSEWQKVIFEAAYALGFVDGKIPATSTAWTVSDLTEVGGKKARIDISFDLAAVIAIPGYVEESKRKLEEERLHKEEEERKRKEEEERKQKEEEERQKAAEERKKEEEERKRKDEQPKECVAQAVEPVAKAEATDPPAPTQEATTDAAPEAAATDAAPEAVVEQAETAP